MKLTFDKTIKKDIDFFIGKPTRIKLIINKLYEVEIVLNQDWDNDILVDAIKNSFLEFPETVHLVSIELDKSKVN